MSFVRSLPPVLQQLLLEQDGVVCTEQLRTHGFDASATYRRLHSGLWQRLLPRVILTMSGTPTRRQLLVAGWLWGGPASAIDGPDACVWHKAIAPVPRTAPVHVATPWGSGARSRDFVVVRRSLGQITIGARGIVPYVDAATGLIVAARGAGSTNEAIAVLSRGLQRGVVSVADLTTARERIGDKWCRQLDGALVAVGVGLRSPLEKVNRRLVLASRVLPEPGWNQWLDLGDGLPEVCADALWADAGMVQDVNGRRYHAWGQQFEDTEARRARMVAVQIVVQAATATQIRRGGPILLDRLERTYLATAGRGMPPGVRLVDTPSWARALRADGA